MRVYKLFPLNILCRKLMVQNLSYPKPDNSFAINFRRRKIMTPGCYLIPFQHNFFALPNHGCKDVCTRPGMVSRASPGTQTEFHVLFSNVELTSWEQELHLLGAQINTAQHLFMGTSSALMAVTGRGGTKGWTCHLEPCNMKSLQPDHCIGRQPTENGLSKLFHTTGIVTLFSNAISKLN